MFLVETVGAEDLPTDPAGLGASEIALQLWFSALVRGPGGPPEWDHAQNRTRKGRGSRSPAATRGSRPALVGGGASLAATGAWRWRRELEPGARMSPRGRSGARLGLEPQLSTRPASPSLQLHSHGGPGYWE